MIALSFAFMANTALGITLNCEFKIQNSYWGTKYACVANNLTTYSSTNRTVTEIVGTHLEGKTNDDVVKVLAEHQSCPYLPLNLGAHFKNLEILYVMKSHVMELTNNDLDGLTKLRIFDVSYNPITRLHREYFIGHESIEMISFYDCELYFIQDGVFEPLVNLKEGHFQFNRCVDFRGDEEKLLPNMIKKIEESCDPKGDYPGSREVPTYDYDERDSWDYGMHHFTTTTEKPPKIVKEIVTEYKCNLAFTRRNANAIIFLLLVVIIVLIAYMLRINAFDKQNLFTFFKF